MFNITLSNEYCKQSATFEAYDIASYGISNLYSCFKMYHIFAATIIYIKLIFHRILTNMQCVSIFRKLWVHGYDYAACVGVKVYIDVQCTSCKVK